MQVSGVSLKLTPTVYDSTNANNDTFTHSDIAPRDTLQQQGIEHHPGPRPIKRHNNTQRQTTSSDNSDHRNDQTHEGGADPDTDSEPAPWDIRKVLGLCLQGLVSCGGWSRFSPLERWCGGSRGRSGLLSCGRRLIDGLSGRLKAVMRFRSNGKICRTHGLDSF